MADNIATKEPLDSPLHVHLLHDKTMYSRYCTNQEHATN